MRDPPSTLSEKISLNSGGCAGAGWTTIVGGYIGGSGSKGKQKSAKAKLEHRNTRAKNREVFQGAYRGYHEGHSVQYAVNTVDQRCKNTVGAHCGV